VIFMRLLLGAALILAAAVGSVSASAPSPESGITWEKSFEAALAKARTAGKPVIVDFWAEWCEWCHQLDVTTYADPRVVAAVSERFVAVKVNTEGNKSEVKLTDRYEIESLPTIDVVSPGGLRLLRMDGFQKAERFLAHLERVEPLAREIAALERMLAEKPRDVDALVKLGARLYDLESRQEARNVLQRAKAADGDRPVKERKHVRVLLGTALAGLQKYSDSEKALKEALALSPADPDEDAAAQLALGRTYAAWGKRHQARSALEKAIAMQPQGTVATRAKEELDTLPN
jgi:thioredoxin-like negative regulator of GroEL